MPDSEWQDLAPAFKPVKLTLGQLLIEAEATIPQIYFPSSGVISSLVVMEEGGTIEGLLAGSEGSAGAAAAFGAALSPWRMMVQAEGEALAISPADLASALPGAPRFQRMLFRYSHAMQQLATQSIACNRFHPINERLARWLLMMVDRSGGDYVETTHDFLARMLGVHRPSVSLALATLEHAGLLRHSERGRVTVLDRRGLEAAACECYQRIVVELGRVFD